ncbi:MAG: prefoldin subunit alpha [Promethearchaeota archaeon]
MANQRLTMDDLQKMAYNMEMWEAQLKELDMQRQMMDNGIMDLKSTIEAIDQLEAIESDEETIIPIAQAASIRSVVKKPERYIIGIGSGYSVEQDGEKSKQLLDDQLKKLESTRGMIDSRMKSLIQQTEKVRPILERAVQQMRQNQQMAGASQGPPQKIDLDKL